MTKLFAIVPLFVFAACGKSPLQANSCATKGATYYVHTVEANNGTCGVVPDQIVNISDDGMIQGAKPPECDSVTENGCTTKTTNCKVISDATTCTTTSTVTFVSDGASASGLLTASCKTGAASCASTYQLSYLRQ